VKRQVFPRYFRTVSMSISDNIFLRVINLSESEFIEWQLFLYYLGSYLFENIEKKYHNR